MQPLNAKSIIFEKVNDLPTLPTVVNKVLAIVQDSDTSAAALSSLISYDQAISSRLLKVANSAYYGFMKKVTTVKQSIIILGFKEVKTLTLGIAVFHATEKVSSVKSLDKKSFWMHAIGSSLAAEIICGKLGGVDPETIYMACLLHDIGKLVLDCYFTQEYIVILEKVRENGKSLEEEENKSMGFSHADVGGWLAAKWKFPPALSVPISFHHNVEKSDSQHLQTTSIVHLANILSKRAQIGNSGDPKHDTIQDIVRKNLNLHDDTIEEMVKTLKDQKEKAEAFLGALG